MTRVWVRAWIGVRVKPSRGVGRGVSLDEGTREGGLLGFKREVSAWVGG